MIASVIYSLCAAASFVCFALLWRSYRRSGVQLLFWSSAAFLVFFAANVLLFVDLVLLTDTDLGAIRGGVTITGVMLLLYGLIWET